MAASGSSQGILEVVQYEELDIRDVSFFCFFSKIAVKVIAVIRTSLVRKKLMIFQPFRLKY